MRKPTNRLKYSVLNLSASWLNQLAVIVFRFANRMVFVRVLAKEYLGLSGLFSDVLALLSLAELGVGAAISYHLFKPLAEKDEEQIAALMNLFRRVYTVIGVFVFAAGAALTPFLPFFIKEIPNIPHLSLIYLLFVLNSAVTYFFSYKGVLLDADQHGFIGTVIGTCTNCVATIVQIALLLLTGNYVCYLITTVVFTLIGNFIMSAVADRRYPFLKNCRKVLPTREKIREVMQYIRAMMLHKVGGVAVNSTDNVIISKFIGLAVGGMYSNYVLLSTCLHKIVGQVFSAVGASVGSLGATEPVERQKTVFSRLLLLDFWGYSYAACGLVCVATPLILLCFGSQYEMPNAIPVLLSVSFYLTGMRKTVQTFNSSIGLLRHNRYAPLVEAAINLIVSVWLAQTIGLAGVIIGTIISTVCVPLWVEPLVLYRVQFQQSVLPYLLRLTGSTLLAAAECWLSWQLCALVQGPLLAEVLYRIAVCTVVCNGVNFLVYGRTDEFHFYLGLLRSLRNRLHKKTKDTQ